MNAGLRLLNTGIASVLMLLSLTLPAAAQDEWVPPIKVDIPKEYHGNWVRSDIPDCVTDDPYVIKVGPRSIYRYETYEFLEIAQLNYADETPEFSGMFVVAHLAEFSRLTESLRMEGALIVVTTKQIGTIKPILTQKFRRCSPIKQP